MTFAAGVLLAVVAVDLVINARGAASLHWTVMGLLCGAAVFSSVNWLLSRRGAQHRKRCGECVEQPKEQQQPGSGLAIAAGTLLDGVPEGVVLGLSVLHPGAPGLGTVTAFFLANIERIEEGEVLPYLTDELRVGDRIELRGPIGGYFVWNPRDRKNEGSPLFLVAGGSGITPLMAMIRHRANSQNKVPTKLLYSSRSYDDVVYREELDRISANDSSLRKQTQMCGSN